MINFFKKNAKSLEGRVALVTGASRGIGASIAKALAKEGAHVILVARNVSDLEKVDDAIQALGGKASILPFDLAKTENIAEIAPTIAQRFGKLDILVGNAAILGDLSPVAMSDPKTFEAVMKVNFIANYELIRALDPFLRGSNAGRAVFLTSGAAHKQKPFWGAYAASKAALEELVGTYAREVEYSNLRVNLFDPGRVRTDMRRAAAPAEDPLTLPHPDEIMEKFLYLVTSDCDNTGEIFRTI